MLLFVLYLAIVIGLPVVLSAIIGLRGLPHGNACPHCSHDTFPLVSRAITLARRIHRGFSIQRRWCPACEWDGYAHSGRMTVYACEPVEAAPLATQDLRTLEIGGRPWNVMLESWRENGLYYGRLVFVGPSGKNWCDSSTSFSATTQHEVLAQALSLSDRLLAYRLKEVISG